MTDQTQPSFFSKPLVRFACCAALSLTVLAGAIVATNAMLKSEQPQNASLSSEEFNCRIVNASQLVNDQQYQAALEVLNPIREQLFAESHIKGLTAYAQAQAAVPLEHNTHIILAAGTLARVAETDSTDVPSRVQLFQLFHTLHDEKSALRYGDEAVALSPDDHELQLLVAEAHLNNGNASAARHATDFVLNANPHNIAAAALKVRCEVAADTSSSEVQALIEQLTTGRDDVQNRIDRVLLSLVLAEETNDDDSKRVLSSILKPGDISAATDAARVQMIIAAFEATGRSRDVLGAADRLGDESLLRRFLWAGEHQQVLDATTDLRNDGLNAVDERIIVRFLSHWLNGERDELPKLATRLSQQSSHRAEVWTPVLAAVTGPDSPSHKVLQVATEALSKLPQSAGLWMIAAESQWRLGDIDAAMVACRRAIACSPRWGHARTTLAEMLLERGDIRLAFYEAVEAVKAVPHNIHASRTLIFSAAKLKATGLPVNKDLSDAVLKTVASARHTAANSVSKSVLNAVYCFLNGETAQADKAVRHILQTAGQLSQADAGLLETVATSESTRTAAAAYRRTQAGSTDAELMMACLKAVGANSKTPPLDVLNSLPTIQDALPEVSRQFLFAEVLSKLRHPDAKSNWIAVASAYEHNLRIQRRAAGAAELADDFAARQVIIDRLKSASPDGGILWQVESTRLLLDHDSSEQAAAQAAITMTDVLKQAPLSTDARLLAVRAFERLEKPDRVLSIARDTVACGLNVPALNIRLAELTPARDEAMQAARAVLNAVPETSPLRHRSVMALMQHRDFQTAAVELARSLPADITDTDDHFTRFSMLAMASANAGSVTRILGPIEKLAPTSHRWFQLWLDVAQVSSVNPDDAFQMLHQAYGWADVTPQIRKRKLSIAWRRLAKRSPNPLCRSYAFETLNAVVDADTPASDRLLLAGLAIKAGQSGVAAKIYQRLADQTADNVPVCAIALNNLASLKSADPESLAVAAELADRAWSLEQKPEFVDTIVDIRLKQNRPQDALRLLKQGLTKWPDNLHLQRLAAGIPPESS